MATVKPMTQYARAWQGLILQLALRKPGGTFTLNELGQYVMDEFQQVIPPGQLIQILNNCPHVYPTPCSFIYRHALVPWISIPFDCQKN